MLGISLAAALPSLTGRWVGVGEGVVMAMQVVVVVEVVVIVLGDEHVVSTATLALAATWGAITCRYGDVSGKLCVSSGKCER